MEGQKEQRDRWPELMRQAQAGDAAKYQELLEEITVVLRAFLSKRLSGHVDHVEDVLQEVLMSIHRVRHTYDCSRSFSAWMFAVAKYRIMDFLRRNKRKYSKEVYDDDFLQNLLEEKEDQPHELVDDVRSAIDELPDKQRTVIKLMKIKGLSVKEVSAKTGISESAVKVNAHRGYKMLRKKLEAIYGGN